ncbi:MAG: hypothetical protein R3E66_13765 [bacterium]
MDRLLNAKRIAVVGVAKNCGKTTTLNFLLRLAHADARVVGVMSVGIDGEAEDVLLGTPKPPVHVEVGQWVVTADEAAHAGNATLEFVASLGIETPLGDVVLCRVVEAGEVVLAGLRHRADVHVAVNHLEGVGVDLVVIDGAYGRIAAAHTGLTDGVVVSTGAVVAPHVDGIIERTGLMIDRLNLPRVTETWQIDLLSRAIAQNQCLLGGPNIEPTPLHAKSALLGLPKSRDLWTSDVLAIAVPGLVSDRVIDELIHAGGTGRAVLLSDGTALQTDARHLDRLRRHWAVYVEKSANLLGIAMNPTSVQGWTVPERALFDGLQKRWPEITIFNPIHDLESRQQL